MARIRTVKPEFFRHAGLFDAEKLSGLPLRLAFEGLWTAADREGRFAWEPRTLKLDCLPFDDVDFGEVLEALQSHGFIEKYEVDGKFYGCIPSWHQHQHINQREAQSRLPAPTSKSMCMHVHAHGEGKGRERKGREGDAQSDDETVPQEISQPSPIESPNGRPKEYVFESGVIKLNEENFRKWEKAFPRIDLQAELISLTSWANGFGKDWFIPVSQALNKRNREQKTKIETAKAPAGEPVWRSGIPGVV